LRGKTIELRYCGSERWLQWVLEGEMKRKRWEVDEV